MIGLDADLLILGAGPAGLTAAQYGARAQVKTLVIEQLAPGGQALVIDRLENYPGLIPPKSGYEFAQDLRLQAEEFGAEFLLDSVLALDILPTPVPTPTSTPPPPQGNSPLPPHFSVTLGSGQTKTAWAVVIATGTKHRTLDIPGEAEFYGRGVSYCATCDGPFFKNKRIFVVGGGDAACDEAQFLARLSSQVEIIHRRGELRAQKALAERTLKNPNITVRFNTLLLEIRGTQMLQSVVLQDAITGTIQEEDAAGVFIFAGMLPQLAFLKPTQHGAMPELDDQGYILTDQGMESSIPGLFVAGDVRATPFRQVVVAAGEGAVAAHRAAAYIDSIQGDAYQ